MQDSILFAGTFIMPDKNAAATRVIGIGYILRRLGYNVIYQGDQIDENDPYRSKEYEIDGFKYYTRKKWTSKEYYTDASYLINTIESLKKKIAVVILYHPPAIVALKMKRYCDKNGIKIISDITEWYDIKRQLYSGHMWIRALDFWARMYFVNKRIGNIIAISSYLQDYYSNRKCRTVRIPILNINEHNNITFTDNKGKVVLCYCGSPTKKDLLLPIIIAVQNIIDKGQADVELNIVGAKQEDFEKNNSYSISDKYSEYIKFYGRVPHQQAVSILGDSDFSFIIRPNLRYAIAGFPTKMVEAFSLGIPVIACANGDIPTYVKDGVNGYLINPNNIDSNLSEVLEKIMSLDRTSITKMKEQALLTGSTCFDYSRYVDDVKAFLDGI